MTARNTYFMKIGFALVLALLFTFFVMQSAMAFPLQDEPYQVETFDVDEPAALDVVTSGGHITVEGSSKNAVRVEMYVRKNGRNLLPEDINLEDWDIDISQSGNSITATANRSGKKNRSFFNNNSPSISFVVYTPREMSSNLRTSGGHIETRGLSGNQEIRTSGGHLELANLEGTIEARTSGGHIDITDVQGDLNARTSGGHINVQSAEGTLKVRTSGGHIDLADISGTIEASTSGGGISADLNDIGQFVDLRTSGGNVKISIPEQIGVDLNLSGSYVNTDLKNFSGNVDPDEVEGKLNGGGPEISARTSGGTVSVSFKQ